ncbi:TPA: hypothetical protein HA239_06295 [Candidatus Woesearchaeota archaeon]|nr:hypothetical protein QT06_C0001G0856 [archaeon GW2011_AR15]MBS3103365.1 hypothetical protein [Candidatus Woesearchaeota archaeon]HIH41985.1 hypothetical protein [Candidatus Woesearchaeota archaeon]
MTLVEASITSWYSRGGAFEAYRMECEVHHGFGSEMNFTDPAKMASELVFNVRLSEAADPVYRIVLWEGHHPLDKYLENCGHIRYTQRPEDGLKKTIEAYLKDPELIAAAKQRADKILDPESLNKIFVYDGLGG